jgi:hypothetical protein
MAEHATDTLDCRRPVHHDYDLRIDGSGSEGGRGCS